MPKLLFLQGLPACGKSTLASELVVGGGWVEVNKDAIRKDLETNTGWKWSPENEKQVEQARDILIRAELSCGKDVVSSDTNFARKHKVRLEQLARECKAQFEIKRFDVPVDECLRRNKGRVGEVPEKVIWDMYHKYVANDPQHFPSSAKLAPTPPKRYVRDGSLMPALICDLDGTLSLFEAKGHRGPYDASKADEDDLNTPVWRIIKAFHDCYLYQIIYLSGREEIYRPQTEKFLAKHNCPQGPLYMRSAGDHRKDRIVKAELFDAHVRDKYDVEFCLDDRDQVVALWREMGLTCLQVARGDF